LCRETALWGCPTALLCRETALLCRETALWGCPTALLCRETALWGCPTAPVPGNDGSMNRRPRFLPRSIGRRSRTCRAGGRCEAEIPQKRCKGAESTCLRAVPECHICEQIQYCEGGIVCARGASVGA
jgi:hypothetical protein